MKHWRNVRALTPASGLALVFSSRLWKEGTCIASFMLDFQGKENWYHQVQLSSVQFDTLLKRVLRGCAPAGRRGFSIHDKTGARVSKKLFHVTGQQRWNSIWRGPLLFSARPDLRVLQNRDWLGHRDSLSVCRCAENMRFRHLRDNWYSIN